MNNEFHHFLLLINRDQINDENQLGKLLSHLTELNLELLGMFACKDTIKPLIRLNIYRSLNLTLAQKRRSEPSIFCDRVVDMFSSDSLVAFFRFQVGSSKLKD